MKFLKLLATHFKTDLGVGILALVAVFILVLTSIRISSNKLGGSGGTYTIVAYLADSSGLAAGTAVRSAGIKIGVIDKISLENRLAKLEMSILDSVPIYENAVLSVKALGILGDKYIDIDQGSPTQTKLRQGSEITNYKDVANIDQVFQSISDILADVKNVTHSLSNSLGSEEAQLQIQKTLNNLEQLTSSLNSTLYTVNGRINSITANLDYTVQNTAALTADIKNLVKQNSDALSSLAQNLASLSGSLNKDLPPLTSNLKEITAENRENLKETIANLQKSTEKLNDTLANLAVSTKRIEQGQGTIGQLINNEETAQNVNETIAGLNRFIGEANKTKLDVGFRLERFSQSKKYKGYVSVYYIPRPDHYYILQLIDSPDGKTTNKTEDVATTTGNTTTNTNTKTKTTTNDFLFSLMIAQRYYDTLLRFGLFEGKAGIGADQYFGSNSNYQVSLDAWDFDRENDNAHLRASVLWRFLGRLYLVAGIDDFSSKVKSNRQSFLGVGLDFNEDNLKLIASSLPISSLGK